MTETPMKPLAKIGKSCPIPDRKTTTLKNAKFIRRCLEFLSFDIDTFGKPLLLTPSNSKIFANKSPLKNGTIAGIKGMDIESRTC